MTDNEYTKDLIGFLQELKTLRVELEIYKKALELVVEDFEECPFDIGVSCDKNYKCQNCCTDYYLQKARNVQDE